MPPLVTALIDTFNHEKYIEQALVSVLDQGLSAAELQIVVVDDGSTDRTPAIIQKFTPRVKHVRKVNGGQASAFNAGFAEAQGGIVALLDGDDWWEKGKLAAILNAFDENPQVAAVSHAYNQVNEKTGEAKLCGPSEAIFLNLETPDAAHFALRGWAFLQPSALSVRKQLLARIVPISEALVFSADAPITVTSMAMGTLVLPHPLSNYRVHSDNLHMVGSTDVGKLRRKSEMEVTMYDILYQTLYGLGVSDECVRALLDHSAIEARRFRLRTFGGSRLETFRTEMDVFHSENQNPGIPYRVFKYVGMGAAALLFPAQRFYRLRDWYARHGLGRWRNWLFKGGTVTERERQEALPIEGRESGPWRR